MPSLAEFWNRLQPRDADEAPASGRIVQFQHFADPSLFVSRVPGMQHRFVPSTRDGLFAQAHLAVGDLELAIVRRPPGVASGEGGKVPVLAVPMRGHFARVNGRSVDGPYLQLAREKPLTDTVETEPWAVVNIILPVAMDFIDHLGDADFSVFKLADGASLPIRNLVEQLYRTATDDPVVFGEPAAVFSMRECLLHALYELSRSVTVTNEQSDATRSQRLARKVSEFVDARGAARVGVSDIARELGVSVRTLHSALTAVRGMGLLRYVRHKRLWDVRRALECGNDTKVLVKSVALEHGFWHLGRFAEAYRVEFGETPGETLQWVARRHSVPRSRAA